MINDKWKLAAFCVKAVTGILGGSLVLTNEHPYWSLTVLAIGAVCNEFIDFYKLKK